VSDARVKTPRRKVVSASSPRYKWIVLSNTTLGVLLASVNGTIILISLPAIFRGIHINPLAPAETDIFLWTIMGYMVVTGTLVVTVGRISDMFGRVRFYNLGFLVFTLGSVLLLLTPGSGNVAAIQFIIYRVIQAIGGAFLFANSAALLTDAFPPDQRGLALGLNQIAAIAGSLIGLILGGVLSAIDYRLVFLVSVPIGIAGTIWSYLALHEIATIKKGQKIDYLGNLTFAAGLILILVAITYALLPYGDSPMGWGNPEVIAELVAGIALLILFYFIELRVEDPMFRMNLFRIRSFLAGNASGFLASVARGGMQFMLIIWLQGIWLPLHGYSYAQTPLWAGIYMLPLTAGFLVSGPISGALSDRFGARGFATIGMLVSAAAFIGLTFLPANFSYLPFAGLLLLLGIGQGLFASPNTTAIMNSVPPEHRGVASGMRATFQNSGMLISMGLFFTFVILGLAANLPSTMYAGLVHVGLPGQFAAKVSQIPPTAALFSAFLGYNPMGHLLPPQVLASLPKSVTSVLLGKHFFPTLVSPAFMSGLHLAFYIAAGMSIVAAAASVLRGERYIYGLTDEEVYQDEVVHGGKGYSITGRVVSEDGEAVSGVSIVLYSVTGYTEQRIAKTNNDGAFEFSGLHKEKYLLVAYGQELDPAGKLIKVDESSQSIEIKLTLPHTDVAPRVITKEDHEINVIINGTSGAKPLIIKFRRDGRHLVGQLEYEGDGFGTDLVTFIGSNGKVIASGLDDRGAFVVHELPAGKYAVIAIDNDKDSLVVGNLTVKE
jgi:MFS family permease